MRRTQKDFELVKRLASEGRSDYEVAAVTGVPRGTVQRWRRRREAPNPLLGPVAADWIPPDPVQYCYLLGVYLGDGHVTHRPPGGWTLRVACDRGYPAIITEVRRAMDVTFTGRRSTQFPSSSGNSDVVAISHPAVGLAFPQHGQGKKHLREIALMDWQLALTRSHPGCLIRGLIHSDGCRVTNRFQTKLPSGRTANYSYVRYFFSNLSADIRQIFIAHCTLLGVRVTRSSPRNLTVSHRESVAVLEDVVGPKH